MKELKLQKRIEQFRIRELKELQNLERISLAQEREDFSGLQARIEKLKEKYRALRDQKIKERVEALGVEITEDETRESLLQKEKEYTLERQKVELTLESYYRSMASLVFQLNKRVISKNQSLLRCYDYRFETSEIFIKFDDSEEDEFLLLVYIKDNDPKKKLIVIEDRTNHEKFISKEFHIKKIFDVSDYMVDSLVQMFAKIKDKSKKDQPTLN